LLFLSYFSSFSILPSFCLPATVSHESYTLSVHDALPIFRPTSTVRARPRRPTTLTDPRDDPIMPTANGSMLAAAASGLRPPTNRSEEHTSELQSRFDIVCRLLLEKTKYFITRDSLPLS